MGLLIQDSDNPLRYAADVDATIMEVASTLWYQAPSSIQSSGKRNLELAQLVKRLCLQERLPVFLIPGAEAIMLILKESSQLPLGKWVATLTPMELIRWTIWLANQTTAVENIVSYCLTIPLVFARIRLGGKIIDGYTLAEYPSDWLW